MSEEQAIRIKVEATVLDPHDGEAGIVEVYSGRVLGRFRSLWSAAATLHHWRPRYEAEARAGVDPSSKAA
jgi:hypothetical protein